MRLLAPTEPPNSTGPIQPAPERRFTCHLCQDVGITYAYRRGIAGVYVVVRPCTDCGAGLRVHGAPGQSCRWAIRTDGQCVLCGALPGDVVPGDWNGAPLVRAERQDALSLATDRSEAALEWRVVRERQGEGQTQPGAS